MNIENVKELVRLFEKNEIYYVIIAGFAFDLLNNKLNQNHKDVDMIMLKRDYEKIAYLVKSKGYQTELIEQRLKIIREDGSKADLELVTKENNEIIISGKKKITKIPAILFEKNQQIEIENFKFSIASNEILKLFGLYDRTGRYLALAKKLKVNPELFDKIVRF